MNILYVVQNYYPEDTGGAGRSVQMLAEAMARHGHKVSVARMSDQKKQSVYTHNGVKIYALPMRNIYYFHPHAKKKKPAWMRMVWHAIDMFNPLALWDLNRLLNEVQPDIVNTNTVSGFSTSIFYLIKWKGIKLVHTMRDYYLMCAQSGMYKNAKNCEEICTSCRPFAAVRRKACENVDIFLANSQFVLDRHEAHEMLPAKAKKYVQYNMNAANEMSSPRTRNPEMPVRFGFIGNINPTKGTDVLVKASTMLKPEGWTLKIAGTGGDEFMAHLKNQAPKNITFTGWVSSSDFYQDVDVLICSSTYHDPLPRVIYEAYKSGLPVIASDRGGNPEIIDHGTTGFTYLADDEKALATYLNEFLNMTPKRYALMSASALKKAEDFEPNHILFAYLKKLDMTETSHGQQ